MDTSQKTESIRQLIGQVQANKVVLPEFQRDFVWELPQTYDLFDSLIREIFIGSLIYGIPSFELTVREVDLRPRKGEGSRKKVSTHEFTKKQINEMVKTGGFRLLLDGQQRVTSLVRALTGVDDVWVVFRSDAEIAEPKVPLAKRSLEGLLWSVEGKESPERLSIRVADAYAMLDGKYPRDKDKAALFGQTAFGKKLDQASLEDNEDFARFLAYITKLQDLFKAEKLLSFYLLDTDAEKFSLFFERSNSKGMQLSFIDILAAKLYAGFNLRKRLEDFEDENPDYELDRESVVRTVALIASNNTDVGRSYILSNLTSTHFNEHWANVCRLYRLSLDYLHENHFLLSQEWMPYENMIAPLMMFLREIKNNDFSQMDEQQARFLRFWYWGSIFAERYSLAAHSILVEDTKVLVSVARKEFDIPKGYFTKLRRQIPDEAALLEVYKKTSATYKGVLNLVNAASGGLVDWKNNTKLSFNSKLEDHHIFPREYLKNQMNDTDEKWINCVVNRTLVPKITNIKIGARKPSDYLAELGSENKSLEQSLSNHLVPADLAHGKYDTDYDSFLLDRASKIVALLVAEEGRAEMLKRELEGDGQEAA